MGFDTSSHFSTEFLVFACICGCFHSHKTYCDVWFATYSWKTIFVAHRGITECIYWLPLNATEFNGVDTTGFLKNFVLFMYLFRFVFLIGAVLLKKESHCCKKLNENRKVFNRKFCFIKASELFSLNFFLNLLFLPVFCFVGSRL